MKYPFTSFLCHKRMASSSAELSLVATKIVQLLPVLGCLIAFTGLHTTAYGQVNYAALSAQVDSLGSTYQNAPFVRNTTNGAQTTIQAGQTKTIYYDSIQYNNSITRVYAWIGIPQGASASDKVPGIVLVHGGGGTAYKSWVDKWVSQGYAAISIAVEGQTDARSEADGWVKHAWAGPSRDRIYSDSNLPLNEQWMYHSVVDTILANSLMHSLNMVDSEKIGIMGISWGGVITATTIGVDDRFTFAISAYGCGAQTQERGVWAKPSRWARKLGNNEMYKQVWDPLLRMDRISIPTMWFSSPTDENFPISRQAMTYRASPGPRLVALKHGMRHNHAAAWDPGDTYAFADSVIANQEPWCDLVDFKLNSNVARAKFRTEKSITSATIVYSTDDISKLETEMTWLQTSDNVSLSSSGGYADVVATLPAGTTAWYLNVFAAELVASTGFQWANGDDLLPYEKINYGALLNADFAAVGVGESVIFTPRPNLSGTWSWSGPNGFVKNSRNARLDNIQIQDAGDYIVTYQDSLGNISRDTYSLEVTGSQDVGNVPLPGSSSFNNGVFTLQGAGVDFRRGSDKIHFYHQSLSGDGEMIARVTSVENTSSWAKGGVMIRDSLAANSNFAMVMQKNDNRVAFQFRKTVGAASDFSNWLQGGTGSIKYVRIRRVGDTFRGFYSTVSESGPWVELGAAQTISMGQDVYIGLAVNSHSNTNFSTATFDSVSIIEY
ncbi:MAG TPA: hypothetical protein DCX06_10870 [Opitutae bacterium]|nr:hypothetical protein [Opitutae bacterium]